MSQTPLNQGIPTANSPPPHGNKPPGTRTGVETPPTNAISEHQLQLTPPPAASSSRPSSRPSTARQLQFAGNKDEKVQYKGGSYKVRTGPKGGKYILVKQEKVYLKK